MNTPTTPPPAAASIAGPDAERLTSLCEKTLKRAHDRGELVGRFRVGRAVRYHRATLEAWLKAKAGGAAAG